MASFNPSQIPMAVRMDAMTRIRNGLKATIPTDEKQRLSTEVQRILNECMSCASSPNDFNERVSNATAESGLKWVHEVSETEPTVAVGKYKATYYRQGLVSTVYCTKDSGHWLALKVTNNLAMNAPHNWRREIRFLKIAASDFIVPLLSDEPLPHGHHMLIFPATPGDLADLLRITSIERASVQRFSRDLLSGLAHIHKLGIIHRDVKPANILITENGAKALIADFGIAWKARDRDCEATDEKYSQVGTTCYRAPELLFGNTSYTSAIDIWALGCVIAEMLLGNNRTLFKAGDLGTDLALIQSIFSTLGTPTEETWPEALGFPDWNKLSFKMLPAKPWSEILPVDSQLARDFLSRIICYESGNRLDAKQALEHEFLKIG